MSNVIAKRIFASADQAWFASLSGDVNPVHLDPIAARRTRPGAPIVHGIHTLLWGLDEALRAREPSGPITDLRVRFDKFVYVGDPVELAIERFDANGCLLAVSSRGAGVVRVSAKFGRRTSRPGAPLVPALAQTIPVTPRLVAIDEIAMQGGRLILPDCADALSDAFPALRRNLGASRLGCLAGSSALVGMICPGLHSIFGGLDLAFVSDEEGPPELSHRVVSFDRRFQLLRMEVSGPGIRGSLDAFAPGPPVAQPSMAEVKALVTPTEFAHVRALVVGGSRGLGEVSGKAIAAGGGEVVLTYATGAADAERVVDDILAQGGQARAVLYDVRQQAGALPWILQEPPTHLLYFATQPIFAQSSRGFSATRLAEFMDVHVHGFQALVEALLGRCAEPRVFYPSTTAVEEPLVGLMEYAMAKAAAEALCQYLNRLGSPGRHLDILVRRLPRLRTDQTATLMEVGAAEPLGVMLPILRELMRSDASIAPPA